MMGALDKMTRRVSKSKGGKGKERKDPLLIAIKNDDMDVISNATDVNEKRENVYPLIYAIKKGNVEAVRILINLGANVQKCGDDSPLFVAAGYPNKCVVELLLNFGADPNYVNEFGENPLLNSCEHGQVDNVKLLYDVTDANCRDKWGNTPLLKCSYSRKADSALVVGKFLLEKGAEVDAKNERFAEFTLPSSQARYMWFLYISFFKVIFAPASNKILVVSPDWSAIEYTSGAPKYMSFNFRSASIPFSKKYSATFLLPL